MAEANPLAQLRDTVERAAAVVAEGAAVKGAPAVERPRQAGHGDFATNAAMLLTKAVGAPPREVAARVAGQLEQTLGDALDRVEIAGPGFLNLFLSDAWFAQALEAMLAAGEGWGAGGATERERVNVEFVSANPTGPVHVGHARNAAYGDALARILTFHGHEVTREYYVNDYGTQITNLALSIQARARGEEVPEDGYVGDYVRELAAEIDGAAQRTPDELAEDAVEVMLGRIRASLEAFRVSFDVWFSERSLHASGEVAKVFEVLEREGHTFRHEGALWLRTTDFGDDKDRVLERSSGEHTYFASDCAYALDKRERGFDRFMYVLGADHHGYIGRVRASYAAQGHDPDDIDILIMQFVHLVSGGEKVSMSKRAGSFETLDDLVREIGADAARWFLLARSHDTTIDLDLDLAVSQSRENPVYYVQYAHARLAKLARDASSEPAVGSGAVFAAEERALIARLLAFPDEVAAAMELRAPHRIANYALELAQAFTAFYENHRVLGVEEERCRLALCAVTRRTIEQALDLLGVQAPDSM